MFPPVHPKLDINPNSPHHFSQLRLLPRLRHPLQPPPQIRRHLRTRPRTTVLPIRLRPTRVCSSVQPLPHGLQTPRRVRRRAEDNAQPLVPEQVSLIVGGDTAHPRQHAVEVEIRDSRFDLAHFVDDGDDFVVDLRARQEQRVAAVSIAGIERQDMDPDLLQGQLVDFDAQFGWEVVEAGPLYPLHDRCTGWSGLEGFLAA